MESNFDYYSAFVPDEPPISQTVENLLGRNHDTEYFILQEMCCKEGCIFNQIHDDVAVSWSDHQIKKLRLSKTKGIFLGKEMVGYMHLDASQRKSFTLSFYVRSVFKPHLHIM